MTEIHAHKWDKRKGSKTGFDKSDCFTSVRMGLCTCVGLYVNSTLTCALQGGKSVQEQCGYSQMDFFSPQTQTSECTHACTLITINNRKHRVRHALYVHCRIKCLPAHVGLSVCVLMWTCTCMRQFQRGSQVLCQCISDWLKRRLF